MHLSKGDGLCQSIITSAITINTITLIVSVSVNTLTLTLITIIVHLNHPHTHHSSVIAITIITTTLPTLSHAMLLYISFYIHHHRHLVTLSLYLMTYIIDLNYYSQSYISPSSIIVIIISSPDTSH